MANGRHYFLASFRRIQELELLLYPAFTETDGQEVNCGLFALQYPGAGTIGFPGIYRLHMDWCAFRVCRSSMTSTRWSTHGSQSKLNRGLRSTDGINIKRQLTCTQRRFATAEFIYCVSLLSL
jgi:hypothetical protein